ncbi:MDR family MFS transporter [Paraburkholderia caballeronis]|uniref:Drug resistance transporter, EmrB/QacA subfamily n=1 Tax=Paraburkholderia caballeronis TaxID=416943 RepID=A0A1H7HZQ9_9BURK|nr:MDR family MFS transporter [Paraburkholderia caballeronis]PXW29285.1 EmrB/QacA subfamily drug resistance transporter [Paraburkholderia caballeronis]PXX04544.1 EmrB/QacA subfamily drug resistance transporter [Paraburkholderia caballeronis]RAK05605.1 EmrB/QacA subfamily drug resistance transporter [Paraburkholderia caballeronis]TDV18384.1 EmrB/QacA subfamily drug resistance transporter [Paraburkholderia caballeronis]TDV20078.1 EmrB/QacA subfamily drug resistance transporter [Paraburkholderia 
MAVHTAAHHSSGQVLPFRESLLAMLGVSFVTMLVALDQTVVGTALPTIVAELRGFELYAWVATSYLLASVITVPIFGRLGDYYGRKPFLIASIVVFTGASVLCGMANSMLFLVIARGLQGIGGGMLVGTAFACIPDLFPDSVVRLRWQVLMSSAFGIANAVGPSLGGFLTQYAGWRSVFYVNLPVGLLSLLFVLRYLPHLRQTAHVGRMRLDWPGALLIAIVLGSLQLFVEMVPKHGLTPTAAGLLVASVAGGYALWRWELRSPHAILPVDMFRNPGLNALFTLAVLGGFSMFSLLFYAPLLFQGGFGMSPKEAGLVITPLVVFITIGSIANGRIVSRIRNPNLMLYVGFTMIACACIAIAIATRSAPRSMLMTVMIVGGLGLGFVMPNLTVFAQQTAGREHLGIATALLQSLRMIGGMFGTALTGTLVSHLYANGVRGALTADNAAHWFPQLADPQILINRDAQTSLIGELAHAGHNGEALLEAARDALVGAIHLGIAVAAAIAVVAIWQSRRVPPIRLRRRVEPTVQAD